MTTRETCFKAKENLSAISLASEQDMNKMLSAAANALRVQAQYIIAENKKDIANELKYFKDNNIRLKVLDLPTTMTDVPQGQEWVIEMVNNILIEVLGTIAEQERATIHKRQAEGIESAKKAGKHLGRPVTIKPENWEEVIKLWEKGSIAAKEVMNRTGVKKSTFYKLCKA